MEELIIWCRYFMQANIATGHASLALKSPLKSLQGGVHGDSDNGDWPKQPHNH